MKKTSIIDFFKSQSEILKINCPACNILVAKSKLNEHLDCNCFSSSNSISPVIKKHINKKLQSSASTSMLESTSKGRQNLTSSKLNLKTQRKKKSKTQASLKFTVTDSKQDSEDEIIILSEIPASAKNTSVVKISENLTDHSNLDSGSKKQNTSFDAQFCSEINSGASNCEQIKDSFKRKINRQSTSLEESPLKLTKPYSKSKYEKCDIDCTDTTANNSVNPSVKQNKMTKCSKKHSIDKKQSSSEAQLESPDFTNIVKQFSPNKGSVNPKEHSAKFVKQATNTIKQSSGLETQSFDLNDCFDDNGNIFSELSDDNEKEANEKITYAPYYIANFKYILEDVLSDVDKKLLFNDEDYNFINSFKNASDAAQKLYVRLFQRKYKWIRIDKINYPDITKNPFESLEELTKAGLVESGSSDINLETAMDLLSLPEAKSVAKHFNFNSGKNKAEIKELLLKHSKQHKSVFFMNGKNGIAHMMIKKVKQVIGACYRLVLLPKRLFTRILMIFNLPMLSEDDDDAAAGGQQQQLLNLLQVNKGEISYPEYKQTKETPIFIDRDELIRYEEARQLENDIFIAVENKKFEEAKELFLEAKEEYEDQCQKSFVKRAENLPIFLKKYTSFHVYFRCMTQGVEIYQRLRQYKDAVSLLRKLLKQQVFCQDYKGRWYDRLALNLEQHLKKPQEALEEIKQALQDKNVRAGHRYSLLVRALRITKSFDDDDEFKKLLLSEAEVIQAPKVTIKGRLCPRPILGRRNVFISSSVGSLEDEVTVVGVEQLSIEHYKEQGYTEGIHGEGSTFHSVYALLFWDIIYDGNIPDVFISPYQTHPLDLNSDVFFSNRMEQINNHLQTIRSATIEELKTIVQSTWEKNFGRASLVAWDRFVDLEHMQGLIACLGNHLISGICERLAKDFRFTRSGVPDLVVWNPESFKVKIVEVKGPGDKLSSKQILWLDYLLKLGADAEVCLVEAVASKKLHR